MCAVKDDNKLVDAVIEKLYEEMIAFDHARAEAVMQLIIDRDEAAAPTFRGLLQDLASNNVPKNGQSRCSDRSPTQELRAGRATRTNQADNKHKQNKRPRRQCLSPGWNILQRLDVSHVSRSNARGARRIFRIPQSGIFRPLISLALRLTRSSAGTVEPRSPAP
jgi:hypothetical protein